MNGLQNFSSHFSENVFIRLGETQKKQGKAVHSRFFQIFVINNALVNE